MSAIGYLFGNATQAVFSTIPAAANAAQNLGIAVGFEQAAAFLQVPVIAVGAIGGGALFLRLRQAEAPIPILDRNTALDLIRQGQISLQQIPQLSNDEEIVTAAAGVDPYAIQYAGQELRQDLPRFRGVALASIEKFQNLRRNDNFGNWILNSFKVFFNGSIMSYLPEFQNDYEMIYELSQNDPSVIQFAGAELYQDPRFRELVLSLVRRNSYLLEHAGAFRNDYEIVGTAIAVLPDTLQFAGQELRESPEFQHLQSIAYQRTTYIGGGEEPIPARISIQEALSLLHRNPNSTLENEVNRWTEEYKKAFHSEPNSIELNLNDDEGAVLKSFLQRIREVQDYRDGGSSREHVVARVERMLTLATNNKEFQGDLIALLTQALTDCGDNVLVRFNDIEAMAPLYTKTLSLEDYREAAIRYQRYEALKKIVLSRHAGNEELEALLYLQLELKDLLPISTRNMAHRGIVNIPPERVLEIRNEISSLSDEDLLAKSEHWQKRMKDQSAAIDNHYGKLLNDMDDYFGKETDEEKKAFLDQESDLKAFFNRASEKGVRHEYSELCDFVVLEKNRALANL